MRGFDTKMLFVRGSRLSANPTANGTRQEIPARLACLTHRANRAGQSTPTGGVNSPLDNSAPRAVRFKGRARLAMLVPVRSQPMPSRQNALVMRRKLLAHLLFHLDDTEHRAKRVRAEESGSAAHA